MLDIAKVTKDSRKRRNSLDEALKSFLEAQKDHTLQYNMGQWVNVRVNMVTTYVLLENSGAALELSNRLYETLSDNRGSYISKIAVLHDGLFQFKESLELHKAWLERNPDDFQARLDSPEQYFTVGEFSESVKSVDDLLSKPYTPVDVRPALRGIEIACLLSTQPSDVLGKFQELIDEVKSRPANFRVNWVFRGTRYFVGEAKQFSEHREWLLKLFDALEYDDRETLLHDLSDLKLKLKD